ncbi:MAG TPA: hypothetical protein VL547_17385 [Dinghuibacter sp.]|uniref:hypothetical protein n=1 Tax=Dinghuibacter sp. TaxID=2024697 RepID=UPI002BFCB42F|nr:hypothetical protein [Dinghuibacter sp.]HTJ13815.1 hypothetical protein [Dinghuibacter sp.]
MFTSIRFLTQQLDIDPDIAKFFVDRDVPKNNRYWKDRHLYVAIGTGFLFIPLVYDILFRLGVDKKALLDEAHIQRMERVLDSAGKVEFDALAGGAHVENCRTVMGGSVLNPWLWTSLERYFREGPAEPFGHPIPPLNRADTFLFSLCDLEMDETSTRAFLGHWYALIGAFLLMDDVEDWEEDRRLGEENAIRFLGEGPEAFARAMDMLREHFRTLDDLNPRLSAHFDKNLQKLSKQ